MYMLGDSYDDVVQAMKGKNNPDYQKKAMRRFNMDLRSISRLTSWSEMRKKLVVPYEGIAIQLPPNLIDIDLVWDDVSEIEFIRRNRSDAESSETSYRYFTHPIGSVLATVNDVTVQIDGTTLSSPDLLATGVTTTGEWFYIEGEDQYYQIASNVDDLYTFSPGYRGTGNLSAARLVLRPAQTFVLDIEGPYEDTMTSSTLDIHYWAQPNLLRDKSDIVPLSTSECLTRRVLSNLPESRERAPMSDKKVKEALDEAIRLNPDKPRARVMRGKNGRKVRQDGRLYSRRNDNTVASRMVNSWLTNSL